MNNINCSERIPHPFYVEHTKDNNRFNSYNRFLSILGRCFGIKFKKINITTKNNIQTRYITKKKYKDLKSKNFFNKIINPKNSDLSLPSMKNDSLYYYFYNGLEDKVCDLNIFEVQKNLRDLEVYIAVDGTPTIPIAVPKDFLKGLPKGQYLFKHIEDFADNEGPFDETAIVKEAIDFQKRFTNKPKEAILILFISNARFIVRPIVENSKTKYPPTIILSINTCWTKAAIQTSDELDDRVNAALDRIDTYLKGYDL